MKAVIARWLPLVGIIVVAGAALIVGIAAITRTDQPDQHLVLAEQGDVPGASSGTRPAGTQDLPEFHPERFQPDPDTGRIDWENLPKRVPIYTTLSPARGGWVAAEGVHGLDKFDPPENATPFPIYSDRDGEEVIGYMSLGGSVQYDLDMNVVAS